MFDFLLLPSDVLILKGKKTIHLCRLFFSICISKKVHTWRINKEHSFRKIRYIVRSRKSTKKGCKRWNKPMSWGESWLCTLNSFPAPSYTELKSLNDFTYYTIFRRHSNTHRSTACDWNVHVVKKRSIKFPGKVRTLKVPPMQNGKVDCGRWISSINMAQGRLIFEGTRFYVKISQTSTWNSWSEIIVSFCLVRSQ